MSEQDETAKLKEEIRQLLHEIGNLKNTIEMLKAVHEMEIKALRADLGGTIMARPRNY